MTVAEMCEMTGMTKQNFYKEKKVRTRREVDEEFIVNVVCAERRLQPEVGARKLLEMYGDLFREHGILIGRDCFFRLLNEKKLLVRKKRRAARTTDSRHQFPVYVNLLKDMKLSRAHQAWVSDITYIRTQEGFVYLSLVMDAHSRKIVGFHAGNSLEAEGCLRALGKAIVQLPKGMRPIHHSDRGSQYCCGDYVSRLMKRKITISMTENNHCYENAKAERLNGILKQEYHLGQTFPTRRDAVSAVAQAVTIYNNRRLHTALNYKTPAAVHEMAA